MVEQTLTVVYQMVTALHYLPCPPSLFVRMASFTLRCWKYQLLTFPVFPETKTCLFKQPIHSWEHLKGACWGTFILLKCFTLYYLTKQRNTHWIWWCQPWHPEVQSPSRDHVGHCHHPEGVEQTEENYQSSVCIAERLKQLENSLSGLLDPRRITRSHCSSYTSYGYCYLYPSANWIIDK